MGLLASLRVQVLRTLLWARKKVESSEILRDFRIVIRASHRNRNNIEFINSTIQRYTNHYENIHQVEFDFDVTWNEFSFWHDRMNDTIFHHWNHVVLVTEVDLLWWQRHACHAIPIMLERSFIISMSFQDKTGFV